MPVSSLVKFRNRETSSNGKKLFWERADVDGAPYRGNYAPLYTEEEYEARVTRVADPRNGYFDTNDPEQNKKYLEVLDGIANGWFQCLFIQRFIEGKTHYIEWVEYYQEDGSRTPHVPPGVMEIANGQTSLFSNPPPGTPSPD